MKIKYIIINLLVLTINFSTFADSGIMAENARDYEKAVDEVISNYIHKTEVPTIDKVLRIQASENDMLALARLDPSLARTMPILLLANHARLKDLRHLPGELIVARAKVAGIDVLADEIGPSSMEYSKGRIFPRTKRFNQPSPTSTFPGVGDWSGHHAYARYCLANGEYEEAAEHFFKAVEIKDCRAGTKRKLWEFENLISSAWSHLLNGSLQSAKECLQQSQGLNVQAPPSNRTRYLEAILTGRVHPSLNISAKNSLVLR